MLTEDLGRLELQRKAPDQKVFDMVVDNSMTIRMADQSIAWKVCGAEVNDTAVKFIIRPAYCRRTSKKFRLGSFTMPASGFKKITSRHLGLNYRNGDGKLRILIVTTKTIILPFRPIHIKEIYTT